MSHAMYKIDQHHNHLTAFKILYITHASYDKNWHSTSHTHHFTELFYIVSGKGAFILSDHEIPVKANDLVIINPNIEHTEKSNKLDSLEYIALGLEGISFKLPKEESQIGLFTYQGDREDIMFYLKKLLYEVKHQFHNYESVCHNIIEILVVKLRRAKNISVQNNPPQKVNQSVELSKHYMNQNFPEAITLDFLAKVCNINKFYLAHIFKEAMGISPIEYLNQIRIKEAKIQLETTNFTIAEIARFNGFSSQSFFSQAFKRKTSQTPSEYRKQYHQKIALQLNGNT